MSNEIQKVTCVQFIETNEFGWHIFEDVSDGTRIIVTKVEDGIISVLPPLGSDIKDFSKTVAGCFEIDSNFSKLVWKANKFDKNEPFNGIEIKFNGIIVNVSCQNADANMITREWLKELIKLKRHIKRDSWFETPVGKAFFDKEMIEYGFNT